MPASAALGFCARYGRMARCCSSLQGCVAYQFTCLLPVGLSFRRAKFTSSASFIFIELAENCLHLVEIVDSYMYRIQPIGLSAAIGRSSLQCAARYSGSG